MSVATHLEVHRLQISLMEAREIQESGATAVKGDLDDQAFIIQHTIEHDIIIHTATADHVPSVVAVLDGIKRRASKGLGTIYIHTSGTRWVSD